MESPVVSRRNATRYGGILADQPRGETQSSAAGVSGGALRLRGPRPRPPPRDAGGVLCSWHYSATAQNSVPTRRNTLDQVGVPPRGPTLVSLNKPISGAELNNDA